MRNSIPALVNGDTYKMVVENQVQHGKIMEFLREIYDFIHPKIDNDYWTLEIEENRGVSSPHTWNEREVFNYILAHDHNFKEMVSTLKLHL